jgi:hypothetical protein
MAISGLVSKDKAVSLTIRPVRAVQGNCYAYAGPCSVEVGEGMPGITVGERSSPLVYCPPR